MASDKVPKRDPDAAAFINKRKFETPPLEFLFRSLFRAQESDRASKRIISVMASPHFQQIGFNRFDLDKLREALRNPVLSSFLSLFETVLKCFSEDVLNPGYDSLEDALMFFGFFTEPSEATIFNDLKPQFISLTSANILNFWVEFAVGLFRMGDKISNLAFLSERRFANCLQGFHRDNEFYSCILADANLGETITSRIMDLQKIFLLIRLDSDLHYLDLVAQMSSFLQSHGHEFDPQLLKFLLLTALSSKKLEYQPMSSLFRKVIVDFSEFVEFLVRVCWAISCEDRPSLKLGYFKSRFEDLPSLLEDVTDRLSWLIGHLSLTFDPVLAEMNLQEDFTNIYSTLGDFTV